MSDTTGLRTLVNTLEEVLDEKRNEIAALRDEVDAPLRNIITVILHIKIKQEAKNEHR